MRVLPGLFPAGTEDVRAWRCFVWRVFWHEGGALCHQIWAPVPLFWHPWQLQPTSTSSSLLGLLFLHLTKYQSHFSDTHDDDSHTQISPRPGLPTSSSDARDDSTTSSSHTFETHLKVKPMQFFSQKDPKSNDWEIEKLDQVQTCMAWQRREG